MNGASLLLVAFKWMLLGRVARLGPLVNGASPVGGEEARGDSPSSPLSLLRLGVGKGGEEPETFLSVDRFNPPLVFLSASPISVGIKFRSIYQKKNNNNVKTRWKFTFLSCKEVQR